MTPIRVQTRSAVLAIVTVISATTVAGCGTTYVDTSITVPDTAPASASDITNSTSITELAETMPLEELLSEIETLMSDLGQRVVDGDRTHETMARIDALWYVAEAQIRAADPDDVYNFEQAIELARSGVEHNRPADPSKGYKIFVDVSDRYLAAR